MISLKTILQYIGIAITLCVGMFFVSPQQVDACSVVLDSSTRFRTAFAAQGGLIDSPDFLDEDNLPFVYMDIKMSGCTGTETIFLHVFGLKDHLGVKYTIQDYPVAVSGNMDTAGNVSFTQAFRADEGPCFGDNSHNGGKHCLIFGLVTDGQRNTNPNILGIIGNLIGRVSLQDAQTFVGTFGDSSIVPNPDGCASILGYRYQVGENCSSASYGYGGPGSALGIGYWLFNLQSTNGNQRLVEYYNARYSSDFNPPLSVLSNSAIDNFATVGFAGLLYNCYSETVIFSGCGSDDWQIVGVPIPYGTNHPDDNGPTVSDPLASSYQEQYIPLAPLPFPGLDGGATPDLPTYLQGIFNAAIIVIIVLAVIMIVFAGVTHFFSVSATGKEGKRELAWNAVIGLVIALGSWLLLNTISPRLASNLSIQIPEVELTIDQQLYGDYEQLVPESGEAFVLSGTFENPQTSPGLSSFLNTVNNENPITNIVVNTSVPNMVLTASSGSSVTIPVTGLGQNGVAEVGQGVSQDRKTPKGDWQTTNRTKVAQNMNDAQISQGGFSMGPAFIATNITTSSGQIRGIWIHGNRNNQPGYTMGCVRLSNDDVLALARKINPGVSLVIQ